MKSANLSKNFNSKKSLDISSAQIGFLSSSTAHKDRSIDLHELMISRPTATFLVKMSGNEMKDSGILNKDLLVVDKSRTAKNNDLVISYIDGEFFVRKLVFKKNSKYLVAQNKGEKFRDIKVRDETIIWGVVTGVVRQLIK